MSLYASGIIRIISDPTLKSFDSGTQVANFACGISEGKNAKGEWINNVIDVEVWGKNAEVIVNKCRRGDSIMVTGNVKRQDWEDKKTGDKRSKHVLAVSRFEFLPRVNNTSDEPAF